MFSAQWRVTRQREREKCKASRAFHLCAAAPERAKERERERARESRSSLFISADYFSHFRARKWNASNLSFIFAHPDEALPLERTDSFGFLFSSTRISPLRNPFIPPDREPRRSKRRCVLHPAGKKISSPNCVTTVKQDLPDSSVIRRNVVKQADDQRQGNELEGIDCYHGWSERHRSSSRRFQRRSLSCLKWKTAACASAPRWEQIRVSRTIQVYSRILGSFVAVIRPTFDIPSKSERQYSARIPRGDASRGQLRSRFKCPRSARVVLRTAEAFVYGN